MNDHNIVITPTYVQDIRPIKIADNVNKSQNLNLKNGMMIISSFWALNVHNNYPKVEYSPRKILKDTKTILN
jgi:hypothetical protein